MNKTIAGALLLTLLVVVGALGVKIVLPHINDSKQKWTSDANRTKGKIKIALDNWIGYFIIQSPELKKLMRKNGYILQYEYDNGDYDTRIKRLADGAIDFAVATVDSYILNAVKYDFPGAIVMVIDESKGGDAILARKDKITSFDDLRSMEEIRVAFTPGSPSHHLAKATADHFNVRNILPAGHLRIETDGSEKALEKLLSGKADIAVCWEPDVSKALEKESIIKIIGTEDTEKLIVDILIVNRRFLSEKPKIVSLLLKNYFRALKQYNDDPELLQAQVIEETGLSRTSVASMLRGVKWANFNANCNQWFGISHPGRPSSEGLVETIESTVKIQTNAEDFHENPLPDEDPYRITNSSFLEELFTTGISGFTVSAAGKSDGEPGSAIATRFPPLAKSEWDKLVEVGTLKVDPIVFQRGASELDVLSKQVIDSAAERLSHYPNFRVIVRGHTGVSGDRNENIRLSRERADAVASHLVNACHIDENRLRTSGLGGTAPLTRKPGETLRAWKYRLPRVELSLVREDF